MIFWRCQAKDKVRRLGRDRAWISASVWNNGLYLRPSGANPNPDLISEPWPNLNLSLTINREQACPEVTNMHCIFVTGYSCLLSFHSIFEWCPQNRTNAAIYCPSLRGRGLRSTTGQRGTTPPWPAWSISNASHGTWTTPSFLGVMWDLLSIRDSLLQYLTDKQRNSQCFFRCLKFKLVYIFVTKFLVFARLF